MVLAHSSAWAFTNCAAVIPLRGSAITGTVFSSMPYALESCFAKRPWRTDAYATCPCLVRRESTSAKAACTITWLSVLCVLLKASISPLGSFALTTMVSPRLVCLLPARSVNSVPQNFSA